MQAHSTAIIWCVILFAVGRLDGDGGPYADEYGIQSVASTTLWQSCVMQRARSRARLATTLAVVRDAESSVPGVIGHDVIAPYRICGRTVLTDARCNIGSIKK